MRRTSFLLPALCLLGCGEQRCTAVEGIAEIAGRPAAGATVVFDPVGKGLAACGIADAQGRFRLTTHEADDGAFPGEYHVTIVPAAVGEPSEVGAGADGLEDYGADRPAAQLAPRKPIDNSARRLPQTVTVPDPVGGVLRIVAP